MLLQLKPDLPRPHTFHVAFAFLSLSLPHNSFFFSLFLLLNPRQPPDLPENLGHVVLPAGQHVLHVLQVQATLGEVIPHRQTFAD